MKHNYLKHILLYICLLAGINSFAEDVFIDGICYNLDIETGTAEVGQIHSFMGDNLIIPSSVESDGVTYCVKSIGISAFSRNTWLSSVTISEGITIIKMCAFSGCTNLVSLSIPNSVTVIDERAFYDCTSLEKIDIPDAVIKIGLYAFDNTAWYNKQEDGVVYNGKVAYKYKGDMPENTSIALQEGTTVIADNAFSGLANLQSIVFPNTLKHIGSLSFGECRNLTTLFFPDGLISIGENAFFCCYGLEAIVFPNTVTDIGRMAFSDCSQIKKISLPNSITEIKQETFKGCRNLVNISIPNSVRQIGSGAFSECTSLTSVLLSEGLECIESFAFSLCSALENINLPDGLKSLGIQTFMWCDALSNISVPNSVTEIGYDTFYGCRSLASVTIGNGVTRINDSTFEGCNNLTSVTIGNSITSIDSHAFYDCKLRNVLIKCSTPPIVTADTEPFSNQTLYHTTLYVPAGCWDAYAYDNYWYQFINIRETAMAEEEVSPQQAYTLMDAETFAYSVYDPVNDCIGTINSAGSINEDNPNHSWQMMEAGGLHYLYNIGAKKYAKREGNSLCLCDEPTPIDVADGDNGLILAGETGRQWALVSNERLSASQAAIDQVTGIRTLSDSPLKGEDIYNFAGQRLNAPQKGLNIIGSRKVLMK